LWFDGNDYIFFADLIHNSTFTTKVWLRPEATLGTFYSINRPFHETRGAEAFLDWTVFAENNSYEILVADGKIVDLDISFASPELVPKDWVFLASQAIYDDVTKVTLVTIYINLNASET
jgi:hypothetical protein